MAAEVRGAKSASVTINPHNQNLESVNRIVAHVLGLAGCGACGRLAFLKIDLLGDPPTDLAKDGAISFSKQGF